MRANLRQALRALAMLAALGASVPAPAQQGVPELSGRTVDRAGVLSTDTRETLEALLERLEQITGAQVAVLTIPDLAGEPIESYAHRVAASWALGSRERDDGVLLLVAVGDRQVRIEVGYGLEERLPDLVAGRIIHEALVPHLRVGDYDLAVLAGVRRIAVQLAPGESWPRPAAPRAGSKGESSKIAVGPIAAEEPAPAKTDWRHLLAFAFFMLVMPLPGALYGLFARTAEARGITFGGLLIPIFLGASLVTDELFPFPPESGKFLLGGVLAASLFSVLFWWLHLRLRKRPEFQERCRQRLDELADGRLVLRAAAKLGIPVTPDAEGGIRWLRWAILALLYLGTSALIAALWHPGYALLFLFNLFWLFVIYRGSLHPSPSSSGGGRSWSLRSSSRRPSSTRSSSTRRSRGFRGGGGSFGGGGASGRW